MDEPNIDVLPMELVENIISHMERRDLLSLRLTCKQLEAKGFHHFINTFFKTRSHLYTRRSLEVLVAITRHPAFSRKLEKVTFVAEQPAEHKFNLEPMTKGEYNRVRLYTMSNPPTKVELKGQRQKEIRDGIKRAEKRVIWQKWEDEVHRFQNDGLDITLLTTIFKNLQKNQTTRPVQVAVLNYKSKFLDGEKTYGYEAMFSDFGVQYRDITDSSPDHAVHSVISALARTRAYVGTLQLRFRDGYNGDLTTKALCWQAQIMEGAVGVFSCLTELEIDFGWDFSRAYSWIDTRERAILSLLGSVVRLQRLRIGGPGPLEENEGHQKQSLFDWIMLALPQCQLQKLEVDSFEVTTEELMRSVRKYGSSLQDLRLSMVELPIDEQWDGVLKYIATGLDLEYLWLRDVKRCEDVLSLYSYSKHKYERQFEFRGSGHIRQGLDKLRRKGCYRPW